MLVKTNKLDWIITGSALIDQCFTLISNKPLTAFKINHLSTLSLVLTKAATLQLEEQQTESNFQSTVRINENGRFLIRLPFKESPTHLGQLRTMDLRRFLNIKQKLDKDSKLAFEYHKYMKEYHAMGHMKLISTEPTQETIYYLSHHSVTRKDCLTTKTRMVFDTSVITTSSLSLNGIRVLLKGPTVQPTLYNILLRFVYIL